MPNQNLENIRRARPDELKRARRIKTLRENMRNDPSSRTNHARFNFSFFFPLNLGNQIWDPTLRFPPFPLLNKHTDQYSLLSTNLFL